LENIAEVGRNGVGDDWRGQYEIWIPDWRREIALAIVEIKKQESVMGLMECRDTELLSTPTTPDAIVAVHEDT
jgi:hypothetical protein